MTQSTSFPRQFPTKEGRSGKDGLGLFKEVFVAPALLWDPDYSWELCFLSNCLVVTETKPCYFWSELSCTYLHRSAPEGMNVMNVIQWISMLQEVGLILCTTSSKWEIFQGVWEVWLQRPGVPEEVDLRGDEGARVLWQHVRQAEVRLPVSEHKTGAIFGHIFTSHFFRMARYLEVLNMPDDFRELLDEYMDASERSDGQKACEEFFQCPYSIKESVKRNFSGNSL